MNWHATSLHSAEFSLSLSLSVSLSHRLSEYLRTVAIALVIVVVVIGVGFSWCLRSSYNVYANFPKCNSIFSNFWVL